MTKYIRNTQTGVLYLKDDSLVATHAQQEFLVNSIKSLQNQINTLSDKLEKLAALIHTGQKWQQTPDQM